MSTEQAGPYTGSIPHAYRNAIFWRWAPGMPRGLPSAFVTLLYALGTAADASGKLQFRDGKPIRIKDIAAAIKADEKDARRYVNAALAAGVLLVEGERTRGRAALYVLVVAPRPDWEAALASFKGSQRVRAERKPPPWRTEEKNGGRSPELQESENGGRSPELSPEDDQGERGAVPRTGSGDRPPNGSGGGPPNNPWEAQGASHEIADVGEQPQVDPGRALDKIDSTQEPGYKRCRCGNPLINLPGRITRTVCQACANTAREAS